MPWEVVFVSIGVKFSASRTKLFYTKKLWMSNGSGSMLAGDFRSAWPRR